MSSTFVGFDLSILPGPSSNFTSLPRHTRQKAHNVAQVATITAAWLFLLEECLALPFHLQVIRMHRESKCSYIKQLHWAESRAAEQVKCATCSCKGGPDAKTAKIT